MNPSNRETVKTLCKSLASKLENQKSISFPPRLRQIVFDEFYALIGPYIMTDEDVREKAIAKMGSRAEAISESASTESDAMKTAKKMVRESFGDDVLNGFYFTKPLKQI